MLRATTSAATKDLFSPIPHLHYELVSRRLISKSSLLLMYPNPRRTSTQRVGSASIGRRRRRLRSAGRTNLATHQATSRSVSLHSSVSSYTPSKHQNQRKKKKKQQQQQLRPKTASLLTRRRPIVTNWPMISKSREHVKWKKLGGRGETMDRSKKTKTSTQMPLCFQIKPVNDHDWTKVKARQNPWEYITTKPVVRKTYRAEEMEDTKCSEDAPAWFLHGQQKRPPPPSRHIKMYLGDVPGRMRVLLNAEPGKVKKPQPDTRYGGRLQWTRPSIEWSEWAEARIRNAKLNN